MVRVELLFSLVTLALWIFCLVDVIGSDEGAIRHLPKIPWVLIVLFFPLVGGVAWFLAGRPVRRRRPASPYERPASGFPEYDRPGRAAGLTPESDEEFLRRVRERAEEQRRRAAEERLRRAHEPE